MAEPFAVLDEAKIVNTDIPSPKLSKCLFCYLYCKCDRIDQKLAEFENDHSAEIRCRNVMAQVLFVLICPLFGYLLWCMPTPSENGKNDGPWKTARLLHVAVIQSFPAGILLAYGSILSILRRHARHISYLGLGTIIMMSTQSFGLFFIGLGHLSHVVQLFPPEKYNYDTWDDLHHLVQGLPVFLILICITVACFAMYCLALSCIAHCKQSMKLALEHQVAGTVMMNNKELICGIKIPITVPIDQNASDVTNAHVANQA